MICLSFKPVESLAKKDTSGETFVIRIAVASRETGKAGLMLQNIRITNRRMIFMTLLVWLTTQALTYLEPFGVPQFVASSLATTGLFALPAVLLWPWMKSWLLESDSRQLRALRLSSEARSQALVSAEIAALSAMLLFFLTQMNQ